MWRGVRCCRQQVRWCWHFFGQASPDSANDVCTRRNADKLAEAKNVERDVAGQVARLTAEAAELQRFAQEYMVKAAQEKQKVMIKPYTTYRAPMRCMPMDG